MTSAAEGREPQRNVACEPIDEKWGGLRRPNEAAAAGGGALFRRGGCTGECGRTAHRTAGKSCDQRAGRCEPRSEQALTGTTHSPASPVGLSGNRLLASLPDANARLLAPHLGAVAFDRRYCFGKAHEPIEHVYFIEQGLASINAGDGGGKQVETGLIGPEGMTGVPVVLRDDRSAFHTYAETAGRALRIEAAALREALDASPSLHTTLLRYANALMVQVAHTALANGRCTIEQRLARWLLMAADRVEGGTLTLTHELLALMLGVRRAGVTTALHELESRGLVRVQRGRVAVADRHGLEALAGGAYGPAEAVYRRLIG